MTEDKEKELKFMQILINMMENGIMICVMAMVFFIGQMEIDMKANGITIKLQVMDKFIILKELKLINKINKI